MVDNVDMYLDIELHLPSPPQLCPVSGLVDRGDTKQIL